MLTRKGFMTALLGAVATACGCASKPKPKTPCDGGNIMVADADLAKVLHHAQGTRGRGYLYMTSDLHLGCGRPVVYAADVKHQRLLKDTKVPDTIQIHAKDPGAQEFLGQHAAKIQAITRRLAMEGQV